MHSTLVDIPPDPPPPKCIPSKQEFQKRINDLELFGEPIIQTHTARMLGILYDQRLSFNDHMKKANGKGLQATGPVAVTQRDKMGRQTIIPS